MKRQRNIKTRLVEIAADVLREMGSLPYQNATPLPIADQRKRPVKAGGPTRFDYWCRHFVLPVTPDGCWEWNGFINQYGYGLFFYSGRNRGAHRYAYEAFVGPLPDGIAEQIDHLCRNRACVNPTHLELVDQRTNILRGTGTGARNAVKTHCINGHPYDEANTIVGSRRRDCRACKRASMARRRANRRVDAGVDTAAVSR